MPLQQRPDSPVLSLPPPAVPISSAGARKGLVSPCPGPHGAVALAPYGTSVVAAEELVLVAEE